MESVGVSFQSHLSSEEVREQFVEPLRAALEEPGAGIYSNHVRQPSDDPQGPAEHLLIFMVRDFQAGLRLLRLKLQELGRLEQTMLHNLAPSRPLY